MRCGVVAPLGRVLVVIFILGNQLFEECVQVRASGSICIFIDHQRRARVLQEDRGGAGGNTTGTHDALDGFSDFVSPFSPRRDAETVGVRFHILVAANEHPPRSVNAP